MKQVEHTNSEREMLVRVRHPFLVNLWGTFADSKNLYMVMDFVAGGELFSLLRKSQVRAVFVVEFRFESCWRRYFFRMARVGAPPLASFPIDPLSFLPSPSPAIPQLGRQVLRR